MDTAIAEAVAALHAAGVRTYPYPRGRVTLVSDGEPIPPAPRAALAADPGAAYRWLLARYTVSDLITLAIRQGCRDEVAIADHVLAHLQALGKRLEYWAAPLPGGQVYPDGTRQVRLHYLVAQQVARIPGPDADACWHLGFVADGALPLERAG